MEAFIERKKKYFSTRTPEKNGIISYLGRFVPERKCTDIYVDHNNYLGMDKVFKNITSESKSIMMSGIFLESCNDNIYHTTRLSMAKFLHYESSYICQSGYMANVNVLQAVATKDTPIYMDEKAHASFYDGARTTGGRILTFKHNDMSSLKSLTAKFGPGAVLVDSVYSAAGTFAPLIELRELCTTEGHILVIDESHSLALYNDDGSGYCSMLGVKADFITASLSKAFCIRAGVIASSNDNLKYMAEVGFPAIFSSVVEELDMIKISLVIEAVKSADISRLHLMDISYYIRKELVGLFGVVDTPYPSPIIALISQTEHETLSLQKYLQLHGIFGAIFCKPATKLNASVVRLTLNSNITMNQAKYIVDVIKKYKPMIAKL